MDGVARNAGCLDLFFVTYIYNFRRLIYNVGSKHVRKCLLFSDWAAVRERKAPVLNACVRFRNTGARAILF